MIPATSAWSSASIVVTIRAGLASPADASTISTKCGARNGVAALEKRSRSSRAAEASAAVSDPALCILRSTVRWRASAESRLRNGL